MPPAAAAAGATAAPVLQPLPLLRPLPMPPALPWRTHTTYDSIYAAPGMVRDTNPIPHALEQLRVAALGKAIGGGGEAYKPLFEIKPDEGRKYLWWEQLKQSFAVLSEHDEGVQALADAAATSVGGLSIVAALVGVACVLVSQLRYATAFFGASLGLGLFSSLFRKHPTFFRVGKRYVVPFHLSALLVVAAICLLWGGAVLSLRRGMAGAEGSQQLVFAVGLLILTLLDAAWRGTVNSGVLLLDAFIYAAVFSDVKNVGMGLTTLRYLLEYIVVATCGGWIPWLASWLMQGRASWSTITDAASAELAQRSALGQGRWDRIVPPAPDPAEKRREFELGAQHLHAPWASSRLIPMQMPSVEWGYLGTLPAAREAQKEDKGKG